MNLLALAWMAEVGLMTYRITHTGRPDAAGGGKVPWPSDFVATFVVFGGLSLVAEIGGGWDRVAAATGWGLVLATVLNLVDPTSPLSRPHAPENVPGTTASQVAQAAPGNPLAQALQGQS